MAGITQLAMGPKVPGDQPWAAVDIAGPTSYTQVTPANPIVTGGQQVDKSVFGMNTNIVFAVAMGSDDGQYEAVVFMTPFNPGQPTAGKLVIQWKVSATGAEVAGAVNLSARTIRVLAIGRN